MEKHDESKERKSPWVIIPPTVLADNRLSAGEKLVYGRVFGFIDEYGYCRGSNDYLGRYIGMSKNTVRNYLSRLYDLGYLSYELIRDDKGEVVERRIYPTPVPNGVLPRTTPRTLGSTKDIKERIEKNVRDRNRELEYYAGLLADKLNDRKSITYYRAMCKRYPPQALIQKAQEIVADGGARNPAAVFVGWLKKERLNTNGA
jgi:DNA-binding transcriptional ArsR family regulator